MLFVNDENNDNDELFRRASQDYPLKTDSADWEAVRAKMNAAADTTEPVLPKKKRNYKFLLLLLLLIPLFILENKYDVVAKYFAGEGSGKNSNTAAVETTAASGSTTSATTTVQQTDPQVQTTNQVSNEVSGSTSNVAADPSHKNTVQSKATKTGTGDELFSKNSNRFQSKNRSKTSIKNAAATEDEESTTNTTLVTSDILNNKTALETAPQTKVKTVQASASTEENNVNTEVEIEKKDDKKLIKKDDKVDEEKKQPLVTTTKQADKKERKSNKKFYIGLMAGPDFSTVKLQSVKKTGLNFGIIAGYKISKRFALETGLVKVKKFYNTDGKHFSTKNIYLPSNAKIKYAAGECNMLEWPMNLQYTFSVKAKSAWFAAAGVSSYFMKDEAYTYDVERNGYVYPYSTKYKTKSTTLLAVVNLSAGYTYKLGKIADLRIEPYIKLPVGKIGTGNLPIQSFGISLGITKTIF